MHSQEPSYAQMHHMSQNLDLTIICPPRIWWHMIICFIHCLSVFSQNTRVPCNASDKKKTAGSIEHRVLIPLSPSKKYCQDCRSWFSKMWRKTGFSECFRMLYDAIANQKNHEWGSKTTTDTRARNLVIERVPIPNGRVNTEFNWSF